MIDEEFLRQHFLSEARELLEKLVSELLYLENNPDSQDSVQEIFRVMHTLKGSAGMFGYDKLGALTHQLESVYDRIRNHEIGVNSAIISLTLRASDILQELLETDEEDDPDRNHVYESLMAEIRQGMPGQQEKTPDPLPDEQSKGLFVIRLTPEADLFQRGVDPAGLFEELRQMGMLQSFPAFDPAEELSDEEKASFHRKWILFLQTDKDLSDIEFAFMFFNDSEFKIYSYSHPDNIAPGKAEWAALFESLAGQAWTPDILAISTEKGSLAMGALTDTPGTVTSQLSRTGDTVRRKAGNTIKVSSQKLDELINLISELVIINSQLAYLAGSINNLPIRKAITNVEKLSRNLRDNALELRLVPIKTLTVKFQRMVRDLAFKLGKEIDFVVQGEDTELDSNIIANIESPLMHIIRNALDHGIESPADRKAKNKPGRGIIRFIAFYSGAHVFIQVQDDGKGIDPQYIRTKAIDKGYLNANEKLEGRELYNLIFIAGFSTANSLTEVSGRGVGMDVVKRNITDLRGTIEIDSEIDLGTSFSLKLPLTLSIIDTLLVHVDSKPFLVPLVNIESCHKIKHTELENTENRHISFNDKLIPYIYIRELFGIQSPVPEVENLMVLHYNDIRYAMVVDKVLGEHQAVVKPLGHMHRHQEFLTGASILGDGSLALILDAHKLTRITRTETQHV